MMRLDANALQKNVNDKYKKKKKKTMLSPTNLTF